MRLPGSARVVRAAVMPSTQSEARRLAEAGAPAWTLVRADRQTRGRGRMDRRWSSGRGGLYASLILRPELSPSELEDLSLRAAKACASALAAASGLELFIKPPNDILARVGGSQDAPRKVCGILLEASGDTRRVDWVVLGIGVNVANRVPASLPGAASLSGLARKALDPDEVLRALWTRLRRELALTKARPIR